MAPLEIAERDNALWIHVPRSVAAGEESARLSAALLEVCDWVGEREDPLASVVLTSAGPSFWVAPPRSAADCDALGDEWRSATAAVANLAPPAVAVIVGDAVGAGWELALACDLLIASTAARIGSPDIRWGRMPGAGGTQRLVRAVGPTMARRMLLLGQIITANEAYDLGLIHRIAAPELVDAEVESLVEVLSGASPIALAYTKEAARRGREIPLRDGLRLEADLASLLQTTRDRAEGIAAFVDRRPPRFEGR